MYVCKSYRVCLVCTVLDLLFLMCVCVIVVGNTADAYFTPALSSICVKFRIPYQVAGVTFLALGNGAPDVFASVSAFTGGQDVLIGIGALLGATVFVISIVVAAIVVVSPCKVDPYTFQRDIIFHLIAVILMAIAGFQRSVSLTIAWMFLILYFVYVGVVVVGWYLERQQAEATGDGGVCQEMDEVVEGAVHAAFWHSSSTTTGRGRGGADSGSPNSGGYSFLLLGDTSLGSSRGIDAKKKNMSSLLYPDNDSDSSDDESTVNLTGGLITPHFNHAILDDHFASPDEAHKDVPKQQKTLQSQDKTANPGGVSKDGDENMKSSTRHIVSFDGVVDGNTEDETSMDSSRRSNSSVSSECSLSGDLEAPLLPTAPLGSTARVRGALVASARDTMATTLYWQQWRLKRRVRHSFITAEWWEYPLHWKVFAVVVFPFNFLRDATIPTVDVELWSKIYCTGQPILSPLLLLYTFGLWDSSVGIFSAPVLCCFIGFPLSMTVYVLTHASRPPSGDLLSTIWTFAAFIMCVVWIYFFAGELVSCLEAIGTLSGIPPAVLGLTVLAWGNSVGDLFANLAVAKQGLGEMAIGGCYGGPVLNLCVGLGVSFVYAASGTYPSSFPLVIDISSVISIVFAIIIMVSTLVIVKFHDYEMKPILGYFLIGIYALYTLIQLLSLYFEMS